MVLFKHNQQKNLTMVHLFKFIVVLNILGSSLAQMITVTFRDDVMTSYGPVIQLACTYDTVMGSTGHAVQWTFQGKQIHIENTQMMTADFSRYSLSANALVLFIRNAVKEDQGWYTCQVRYNAEGRKISISDGTYVNVSNYVYLPSLNYPECILEPNINLLVGTYVTFNCTVGGSSDPGVNLQLMLTGRSVSLTQHMYGPTTQPNTASMTKNITIEDANAVFICNMTSETFPHGSRSCSIGPIRLASQTTISVPLSSADEGLTSTKGIEVIHETHPTMTSTSSRESEKDNTIAQEAVISVVVVILVVVIIAITLILVKVCKSHRANKANVKAHQSGKNMEQETYIDDEHYDQTMDDTSANDNASSVSAGKTSDGYTSKRNPVYTVVNKTNKTAAELSSQIGNADEMPVYGKVNKIFKNDKSKDETNRENSGFVDNSLYVPSGPY